MVMSSWFSVTDHFHHPKQEAKKIRGKKRTQLWKLNLRKLNPFPVNVYKERREDK